MRGSRKIALKYEQSFPSPWELAGQQVASALDGVCAAVVVGDDLSATAYVALGIARAQAKRRRAAVADLLGEAPPIQALVPEDASYGLSDGILYGVSITKLAYQVEGVPNLHILPSGTGPLDHEAVLRSERWTRLAEGVREVGALLLVAAPGRAKGLESIAAAMDGVVAVGSSTVLPGLRLIARVPAALAVQAPARVRPRTPAAGQQTVSRTPSASQPPVAPPSAPATDPVESQAEHKPLPAAPTVGAADSPPSVAPQADAHLEAAPPPQGAPAAATPAIVTPLPPLLPPQHHPPAPPAPPTSQWSAPQGSSGNGTAAAVDAPPASQPPLESGGEAGGAAIATRVRPTPASTPRTPVLAAPAPTPPAGAPTLIEPRPLAEYERASVARIAAHIAATRLRSSHGSAVAKSPQQPAPAAAAAQAPQASVAPAASATTAALVRSPTPAAPMVPQLAPSIHIHSAPSRESPTGPGSLRLETATTPAASRPAVSKEPLRAVNIPHPNVGAFWTSIIALAAIVVSAVVWASGRFAPPEQPKPLASAPIVGDSVLNPDSIVPFDPPAVAKETPVTGGAVFAVRVAAVGSETDANARLESLDSKLAPALTFTPLARTPGTAGRYQIIAGAFRDSSSADSLMMLLRLRHQLDRGQGKVVRVPYALVVQKGIARDQAPTFVRGYRLKGLPVYALMQEDGSATLYAGAFETREQGSLLLAIFRSGGEEPPIAQRTGRPF